MEGLPNITGSFVSIKTEGQSQNDIVFLGRGAFSRGKETSVNQTAGYNAQTYDPFYHLDASDGETKTDGTLKTDSEHKVFGSSNHVTPCNATIKVWQRVS